MLTAFRTPPLAILLAETAEGMSIIPKKVQLFRVGTFNHPEYGKFEITPKMLAEFKKNFDSKVRKIDLAVDYKHDSDDKAAAWMRSVELQNEGTELWSEVEWTPEGQKVIVDREFRYISPEFHPDYQDNETLIKYGPTLLGAGLTNRPVIKGMAPAVELTEGKGISMDPKDQEIAALKAKIAELEKAAGGGDEMSELKKKLEASESGLANANAKLADAEKAKMCAEKTSAFNVLLSEGKACEAQREPYMTGDIVKFSSLQMTIKLAEGGSGKGGNESTDADDQVHALAEKMLSEKKASSYGEAVTKVLSENPKLAGQIN